MLRFLQVLLALLLFLDGALADELTDFRSSHSNIVVFIEAFSDEDRSPSDRRAAGTGVLLGGGYVLTVAHFKESGPLTGRDALILTGRIGSTEADQRRLVYQAENDKDILLLRFETAPPLVEDVGCIADGIVSPSENYATIGFPITLVYADGKPQRRHFLDARRIEISAVSAEMMFTPTNTTFGFSGAPVFDLDQNGRIVGLIHGEARVKGEQIDTSMIIPIELAESILPSAATNCRVYEQVDVEKVDECIDVIMKGRSYSPITSNRIMQKYVDVIYERVQKIGVHWKYGDSDEIGAVVTGVKKDGVYIRIQYDWHYGELILRPIRTGSRVEGDYVAVNAFAGMWVQDNTFGCARLYFPVFSTMHRFNPPAGKVIARGEWFYLDNVESRWEMVLR